MMTRFIAAFLVLASLQACKSKEPPTLKSPCVGLENSPCGDRRNVNDWWLA
jgi:hypothetical protein